MQSIISETNKLGGSSFFSKCFKFYVDSANAEKNWANIFRFSDNCVWIGCVKHSFLLRDNTFHGCQWVKKQSQDLRYYYHGTFWADSLN